MVDIHALISKVNIVFISRNIKVLKMSLIFLAYIAIISQSDHHPTANNGFQNVMLELQWPLDKVRRTHGFFQ